jgi:predicted TIM-barrel fold metal-dependent hydrolase
VSPAARTSALNKLRLYHLALIASAALTLPWSVTPAQTPLVDHHQHLSSPANSEASGAPRGRRLPPSAQALIAFLDSAGIRRAVVLSVAYQWAGYSRKTENEHERVKAENDWTARQVASYPDRLVAFCSVNPLRPYALDEIARCARDPRLRTGLKLHFGNSDVDVHDTAQVAQLQRVFRAADANQMPIIAHLHANFNKKRPYGRAEAQIFLDKILPFAPNVTVQIAHLAGAGGYDDATDSAAAVYATAIQARDPRTAHLYFDVSGIDGIEEMTPARRDLLVRRMRQIGFARLLYGSDGAVAGHGPREYWASFGALPLTPVELNALATNVAPYLR